MLYRRILVTGANGLLGQQLIRILSSCADFDVLATGRENRIKVKGTSCGYTSLDITDTSEVNRLFQDFTPNVVINCAAMTNVDQCEEDRDTCWKVNVDAVEHLTRCCLNLGSKLVQVSTDFIFDGKDGPYAEGDRPEPVNYYGKSKLAAENCVRKSGLPNWAIARTVLVFGTGAYLSRSNIALWVIDKLKKGEVINVVDDQWRTPTYAPDLAMGLHKLVRYEKNGVYHLSGREFLSIYDFAHKIAETLDLDATLIHRANASTFQQKALRPPRTGFIILKAESEFGYQPRSLEESLLDLGTELGHPAATS